MYNSHFWLDRFYTNTRCSLRSVAQHSQRKGFRSHLVLAHFFNHRFFYRHSLQVYNMLSKVFLHQILKVDTILIFCILYRATVLAVPWFRIFLLRASTRGALTNSAARNLAKNLSYGDWFVLRRLAANISPPVYRRFLLDLADFYNKASI